MLLLGGTGKLANGQTALLKGKVTDQKGDPLSYASVYIKGSTKGTTTNEKGKYQLRLPSGENTIVFRYMGYHKVTRSINLNPDQQKTINASLKQRAFETDVVTVTDKDPAYRIIRKAIASKEANRKAVKSYESQLYSKSTIKADSAAASTLIDSGDLPPGYVYFSEAVSTLKYQYPDHYKEVMHSSKVSGREGAVSLNFAFNTPVTFYKNLLSLGESVQRPLISPIADNAMNYYKYRLQQTFKDQGKRIYRIAVIPKRPNDPVFAGQVHIVDESWQMHSLDLQISRANGLKRFDTFKLRQQYLPVKDSAWQLYNQRYRIKGTIIGISINVRALSQFTDYKIDPDWPSDPFDDAIVEVPEESMNRDSGYWEQIRPFELTPAEAKDYSMKDSMQEAHSKPAYKDSVDSVRNQLDFSDFIFGYDYRKRTDNLRLSTPSLLGSFYNFNPVEGWAPDLEFTLRRTVEDAANWELKPFARYGIANKNFNGGLRVYKSPWYAGAGRDVYQFQDPQPITPFLNTSYALFSGENFIRLFQQEFAEVGYSGDEWGNGWFPSFSVSLQERQPLVHNSDFTFAKSDDYKSNIPEHPHFLNKSNGSLGNFNQHRAFLVKAGLRYKPGLEYMKIRGEKVNLGTDWPTFKVNYRKALEDIASSDAEYDYLEAGFEGNADFKLFGKLSFEAVAGRFLRQAEVPFVDYKHFQGQEIIYQYKSVADFQLLDYYEASTTKPFAEGHFQHNFSGFIWNKIPYARKLKWQVAATGNVLHQEDQRTYWEWGIGLTNLVSLAGTRFLSVHFFQGYRDEAFQESGFRIGFQSPIGF